MNRRPKDTLRLPGVHFATLRTAIALARLEVMKMAPAGGDALSINGRQHYERAVHNVCDHLLNVLAPAPSEQHEKSHGERGSAADGVAAAPTPDEQADHGGTALFAGELPGPSAEHAGGQARRRRRGLDQTNSGLAREPKGSPDQEGGTSP